jgi:hypothetical protein
VFNEEYYQQQVQQLRQNVQRLEGEFIKLLENLGSKFMKKCSVLSKENRNPEQKEEESN